MQERNSAQRDVQKLQVNTSARIPYLYITGAGRSGSTLLAFLLNAHPQMVSISEMHPHHPRGIENYVCSCGALLLQCPFFLEVEQRVNALGGSFSLMNWRTLFHLSQYRFLDILLVRPLRNSFLERIRDTLVPLWPGYQPTIDTINHRTVHVAQAILAITGKKVFVDAQKDSIRIKFLQDIQQLDLKVIHLVRDVRAAVNSIMRHKHTDDIAWATRWWRNGNMNSERARRYVSPHQWLRLTYDELCDDPQRAVNRISDFAGVKRDPLPADFYEVEHHIIGSSMREKKSGGIVKRSEWWKERLTQRDLDIIARIGGRDNRYFGHDWP